jgi:hypothetical protein
VGRSVAGRFLAANAVGALRWAYRVGISGGKRMMRTAGQRPLLSSPTDRSSHMFTEKVSAACRRSKVHQRMRCGLLEWRSRSWRHEACSDQCSEWQLTLWDGRQADAVTASAFMAAVTSRSAGRSGGHTAEGLLPTRGIRQPCAAVPRPRSGDRMLAGGVAQMFLAGHLIRTAHA